jgi:uncharacterized protein (TIGR02284 family)
MVESKSTLTPETISALQELVQINIDSRDGFRQAAEKIEDLSIASFFDRAADDRERQADELTTFVEYNGEEADRSGSYSAAVHRAWMNIREGLSSNNNYALLAEAERGEDQIKSAYEEVLKENPGSAMQDVLTQQYLQVKAIHDHVRTLRDAYKEA